MSEPTSRPNSSRFPPLYSKSEPDQTSYHNENFNKILLLKPIELMAERKSSPNGNDLEKFPLIDETSNQSSTSSATRRRQNLGRKLGEKVNITCKDISIDEIDWKIAFMEQEISTKLTELKKLQTQQSNKTKLISTQTSSSSSDLTEISTNNDYDLLKQEFIELKRDFVCLTQQLTKSYQHLLEKDNLINKLYKLDESENKLNIKLNDFLSSNLNETFNNDLNELSDNDEQSVKKFLNLPETFLNSFKEIITKLWKKWLIINVENENLKTNLTKEKAEVCKLNDELYSWKESFHETQRKYAKIFEEKSIIEEKCKKLFLSINKSFETDERESENDDEKIFEIDLIEKINNLFKNLFLKFKQNENKINSFKKSIEINEEKLFQIIQSITDAEIKFQLFGRDEIIYHQVIENFSFNLNDLNGSFSTLAKLIIQIYNNQLHWIETNDKTINYLNGSNKNGKSEDDNDDDSNTNSDGNENFEKFNASNVEFFNTSKQNHSENNELISKEDLDQDYNLHEINQIIFSSIFKRRDLDVVEEVEEEEEEEDEKSIDDNIEYGDKCDEQLNSSDYNHDHIEYPIKANCVSKLLNENNANIPNYFQDENDEKDEIIEVKNLVDDMLTFITYTDDKENLDNNIKKTNDDDDFDDDDVDKRKFNGEDKNCDDDSDDDNNDDKVKEKINNKRLSQNARHLSQDRKAEVEVIEKPFTKIVLKSSKIKFDLNESECFQEKSDSAFSSEDNCSTPGTFSNNNFSETSDSSSFSVDNVKSNNSSKQMKEEENTQLNEALKKQEITEVKLNSAKAKIKRLKSILKEKEMMTISQYLNDELNAWKELVEHQKLIMVKMSDELQSLQKRLSEKDDEINELKKFNEKQQLKCSTSTAVQTDNEIIESSIIEQLNISNDNHRNNNITADNCSDESKSVDTVNDINEKLISESDISEDIYWINDLSKHALSDSYQYWNSAKEKDLKQADQRRHSCEGRYFKNKAYDGRRVLKMNKVEIVFPTIDEDDGNKR